MKRLAAGCAAAAVTAGAWGLTARSTEPQETIEVPLWRNGTMHTLVFPIHRTIIKGEDGLPTEVVRIDNRSAERQLPPPDPARAHLEPSAEELDAVYRVRPPRPAG